MLFYPTMHFNDRWEERVAPQLPSVRELNEIIEGSVRIQKQRDLFTPKGYRQRVLALYWNPDKNVVFKVDQKAGKVVTCLTPELAREICSDETSDW